ncbi:hypothetical protein QYF36_018273 [Acer negundo]|nr:hypothetical protein QYF36_018273 [Acer negundo]
MSFRASTYMMGNEQFFTMAKGVRDGALTNFELVLIRFPVYKSDGDEGIQNWQKRAPKMERGVSYEEPHRFAKRQENLSFAEAVKENIGRRSGNERDQKTKPASMHRERNNEIEVED